MHSLHGLQRLQRWKLLCQDLPCSFQSQLGFYMNLEKMRPDTSRRKGQDGDTLYFSLVSGCKRDRYLQWPLKQQMFRQEHDQGPRNTAAGPPVVCLLGWQLSSLLELSEPEFRPWRGKSEPWGSLGSSSLRHKWVTSIYFCICCHAEELLKVKC